MLQGLGPVFHLELLTDSRRATNYARRALYALALGVLLGAFYSSAFGGFSGVADPLRLARFARSVFQGLILTQGIAVLAMAPALASGAIAGEIQRKTLHDLLTTELTSFEIVVGKAASRFLKVAFLVLAGLPIVLMIGELGGVGWLGVLLAEFVTLTTAYFLSGLSLLASTQTRSLRGALNATMTLALSWLILPTAIDSLLPRLGYRAEWLDVVNSVLAPSTPFGLWLRFASGVIRSDSDLIRQALTMAGLQILYGTILVGTAAALLRPTYQRRAAGRRSAKMTAHLGKPRPECGDDPMLWKELAHSRGPEFQRPLGFATALMLVGLLVWATLDYAWPSFAEVAAHGYGVAPIGSDRARFQFYLRIVATGIYLVYVLGIAGDTASSITLEHENDTWISLISTPLTGPSLLRSKILGAFHGIRHTVIVLFALLGLGVLAGALHPVALILVGVELAAYASFAGSLGVWVSMRNKQSLKAVAFMTAIALVVNIVPSLLLMPIDRKNPLAYFSCTPLVFAGSIVSHADLAGVVSFGLISGNADKELNHAWVVQHGAMWITILLSTALYGLAGLWIYRHTCRHFDSVLDRPSLAEPDQQPLRVVPTPAGRHRFGQKAAVTPGRERSKLG